MSGSIVGRIILGGLADFFGVWTIFGTIGFGSAIILFALWLPHVGFVATIVGLVLYGSISGGWFALAPAATAAISPVHEAGMRFGLLISSLAVPSLVGPVITSTLITKGNDSFKWAAVWCGVCFILSGFVTNAVPAGAWLRRRVVKSEAQPIQVSTLGLYEKAAGEYQTPVEGDGRSPEIK